MERQTRRYPVGMQDFDRIIEEGFLYVDKTQYVYQMTHDYEAVFLSRPRRFGKTLLSKTIECYFRGKKELFKGLAIEKLEKEWTVYPVIRIDISEIKHKTAEQAVNRLMMIMDEVATHYDVNISPRVITPGDYLRDLLVKLNNKYGKRVVLIIDEYDSALLDAMHDKSLYDSLFKILKEFFDPLKYCSAQLRFVFITGVTKFSQLGIFSALNNLINISFSERYATVCGISKTELERDFKGDIEEFSHKRGVSFSQMQEDLRNKYDGYHFYLPSADIYNPFSLLTALDAKQLGDYWFESGTPSFLFDFMRGRPEEMKVIESEDMRMEIDEFNRPVQGMRDTKALLYQSGYITLKAREANGLYALGFPNSEVREAYLNSFFEYVLPSADNSWLEDMKASLQAGELDDFMEQMRNLFSGVGYDLENKTEKDFQTIFAIIVRMIGRRSTVYTEVTTAIGRIDVLIETDSYIFVMEFKINKSEDEALQQIKDKKYLQPYLDSHKKVSAVGVNFSTETKNITGWRALSPEELETFEISKV